MSDISWESIKDILDSVLEFPPEQRSQYLDEHCHNVATRRSVERLIESYEESATFFQEPAVIDPFRDDEAWVGKKIGPYKLLRKVGAGGMGTVYRAARADDEYDQHVAIKLVAGLFASRALLEKFRSERQILANLNHPNIARLLDGGTLPEGLPFLVMEFIEGTQIDEYCNHERLTIRKRLELFLQVCSAVQYAHQNLVIHRDLKPGNILVTADGTPKLLDFGIAKILHPGGQDAGSGGTVGGFRAMTLDYASPEQLENKPVATTSDVYSLGAVLYVLLTGNLPYPKNEVNHELISTAIHSRVPRKPSTAIGKPDASFNSVADAERSLRVSHFSGDSLGHLRKEVSGDLDAIVLKSIAIDPGGRYSSVEQFADDLRRFLSGQPVHARLPTLRYRAAKFLRRNVRAVSVASIVALAAMVAVVWIVRAERTANRERAHAEQRFKDLRTLANSLIFDIHDSIRDLPGSTPARKMIVDRALQYLDSLSQESPNDPALLRELSWAYQRVAMVQGDTYSASLGDLAGGLNTMQKAVTIWKRLASMNPTNVEDQLNVAYGYRVLSNMYTAVGRPGARDQILAGLAISEPLAKSASPTPRSKREVEREYETIADLEVSEGNVNTGLAYLQKELASVKERLNAKPGDADLMHGLAVVEAKVANSLALLGERKEALDYIKESLAFYEVFAADATNALARREMGVVLYKKGELLMQDDQLGAAVNTFTKGLRLIEPLAAADRQNEIFQYDERGFHVGLGCALVAAGNSREGLSHLTRVSGKLASDDARDSSNKALRHVLAMDLLWQGDAWARLGSFSRALDLYRRAGAVYIKSETSLDADEKEFEAESHLKIASALAKLRQYEAARAEYQDALSLTESRQAQQIPQLHYTIAQAYSGLADLEMSGTATGTYSRDSVSLKRATAFYSKSQEQWSQINKPGPVTPAGFLCTRPQKVSQNLTASKVLLVERPPDGSLQHGSDQIPVH